MVVSTSHQRVSMGGGMRFDRRREAQHLHRVCQVAAIGVIVFIASAAAGAQLAGDREQRITLFTQYLESLRIQAGIPGLSAAITSNGRIIWEGGFGFAD